MLVGPANVGGQHFQDHGVVDAAAVGRFEFRIRYPLHLDLAWPQIHHALILAHWTSPISAAHSHGPCIPPRLSPAACGKNLPSPSITSPAGFPRHIGTSKEAWRFGALRMACSKNRQPRPQTYG